MFMNILGYDKSYYDFILNFQRPEKPEKPATIIEKSESEVAPEKDNVRKVDILVHRPDAGDLLKQVYRVFCNYF